MSRNQGHHLLFFSQKCQYSQRFLKELSNTPYYHNFIHINVDEGKYKIPSNIKSTPSIVVPEFNRPLTGDEVFNWLQYKLKRAQEMNNQIQENYEGGGKNGSGSGSSKSTGPAPSGGGDNIMPFSNEMSGFSDSYALLETAQPMEHNFSFISKGSNNGSNGSNGGMRGNGGGSGIPSDADIQRMGQNDRVKGDFDMAYEKFQRQRDAEVPKPTMRQ